MELAAIWYISAVIANGAMVILLVYIAILATGYWIERRRVLRKREQDELERFRMRVGR